MLLYTPVDSYVDAHRFLLRVLTGAPLAWAQAAVFLLGQWRLPAAVTLLHTLNGAAWRTWGNRPVAALAARVERSPQIPGGRLTG